MLADGLAGELVVDGVTYNGQMPAFPQLTPSDVDSLLAYLKSLQAPGAGSPTTPVPPPQAGDPVAGEQLFVGSERFTGGGATCFGCHSAGRYGGASFGPDLTDAYGRLGGELGLAAWLAAPPSPTMQPIFSDHPLTEAEIADLVAFFASTDGSETGGGTDWMLLGGIGGLAALFALMAFAFKRPPKTYVDRLRSRS